MNDNRFIIIYQQEPEIGILVDRRTGVNYLFYNGAMTLYSTAEVIQLLHEVYILRHRLHANNNTLEPPINTLGGDMNSTQQIRLLYTTSRHSGDWWCIHTNIVISHTNNDTDNSKMYDSAECHCVFQP